MDFSQFLAKMGNLHDSYIDIMSIDPDTNVMTIQISDLFANFGGLAGDRDVKGNILLHGVISIHAEFGPPGCSYSIMDFTTETNDGTTGLCRILLSPSGFIEIAYSSAEFPDAGQSHEGGGKGTVAPMID